MANLEWYHLDANLIISYILDEDDIAKQVRGFITRKNSGNRTIIISTNELGEISKRLLRCYQNSPLNSTVEKKIYKIKSQIKIVGFSDLIKSQDDLSKFYSILNQVNKDLGWNDDRVQQNDRFNISLFAISEAKTYVTADKKIIESRKIVNLFNKHYSKKIKEISDL
jgi:predicted nucleic acid-binding protein